MKKMKKLISLIAGAMLVLMPVLTVPVTVLAEEDDVDYWYIWDYEQKTDVSTGMPIIVRLDSVSDDFKYSGAEGMYTDVDASIAAMSEEQKAEQADLIEKYKGTQGVSGYVDGDTFQKGDSFTLMLPFSGECKEAAVLEGGWVITNITSDSVSFECTVEETYDCAFRIFYKKVLPDELFWLKPMEEQLSIAAANAAAGGNGAAEVSGDYAIPYDIMKWLDEHPGVTLKYKLSYKDKEYALTIPGGKKLANPEVPWYGPEYLIGKFQ